MATPSTMITIKSQLGDDIRRFQVPVTDLSVAHLAERLRQLYFPDAPAPAALNLSYVDDDGDSINLKTDLDLEDAARTQRMLRIRVTPAPPAIAPAPAPVSTPTAPVVVSTPPAIAPPTVVPLLAPPATLHAAPVPVASAPPLMPSAPPASPADMVVYVVDEHRQRTLEVHVPTTGTVEDLRRAVSQTTRVRMNRHELTLDGRPLPADSERLAAVSIGPGSMLQLRKRVRPDKAAIAQRVTALQSILRLLERPSVLQLLQQPVVLRALARVGPAMEALLRQSPAAVQLANSGPFCKRLLPEAVSALRGRAPRAAEALLVALESTPGLLELVPRAAAVVLSDREAIVGDAYEHLRRHASAADAAAPVPPGLQMLAEAALSTVDLLLDGAPYDAATEVVRMVADSLATHEGALATLAEEKDTDAAAASAAEPPVPEKATPAPTGTAAVHTGVTCDHCQAQPIVGARFKCLTCDDFDLCERCEAARPHDPAHPMVKMYQPHRTIDMGPAGFGLLGPSRLPRYRRTDPLCLRVPLEVGGVTPAAAAVAAAAAAGASHGCGGGGKHGHHAREHEHQGKHHGSVRFVRDMTYPAGASVRAGQTFHKAWVLRNDGTRPWPAGARLVHVGGDVLGSTEPVPLPAAAPGAEVQTSVPLVAPRAPGRYVSFWRAVDGDGRRFGQRVVCDVMVVP